MAIFPSFTINNSKKMLNFTITSYIIFLNFFYRLHLKKPETSFSLSIKKMQVAIEKLKYYKRKYRNALKAQFLISETYLYVGQALNLYKTEIFMVLSHSVITNTSNKI